MGCKRCKTLVSRRTASNDFQKILFIVPFFILLMVSNSFSQGSGRIISMEKEVEPSKFVPYFVATFGVNQPSDDAFKVFADDVLFGFGGGIGFRYEKFGVELNYRFGGTEQAYYVDSEDDTGVQRNIELSESKLQARFYYYFDLHQKIVMPVGLGVGLSKSTVDRGYTGIFDKFNGNGINLSPFVGIEYPVVKGTYISIEFEYLINVVSYQGSYAWYNQYKDGDITIGEFTIADDPNGDFKFWDQVGGPNDTEFDLGGVAIALRIRIDLPLYRQ